MQLLVSVRDASEAAAALAGGADLIDAKDPAAGALGAVAPDAFAAIVAAVDGARPVTAALGDGADEATAEAHARAFARAGAALVKLGLAGTADPARAVALLSAAARGAAAEGAGLIAVAYADAARVGAPGPDVVLAAAWEAGASGVLVDTADKAGPGLFGCLTPDVVARWGSAAREAGLLVALAGQLDADEFALAAALGPDVVGVRGAACDGGRGGTISPLRVRALRATVAHASAAALQH